MKDASSPRTLTDIPAADPLAIERWRAARFGMFIHWGPVSLTGHEIGWSRGNATPIDEYDALYKRFNPMEFNASEWVNVARAAGMRYMVLTTKHHDGFCLWNSAETDYNILRSPFARDVTGELADACRKASMPLGVYYSTTDWHHPDFPLTSPGGSIRRPNSNIDQYEQYLKRQTAELIRNYGPLWTLWFDVPQEFDAGRGARVIRELRALQPDILINDRTGHPGDYATPEQRVGGFNMERPWESCMTLCQQWAWKPDDRMKSLRECIQTLVRTAGADGNLLLNVGPDALGRMEPRQVARLRELGAWLERNGETIYGTRGGPYRTTRTYAATRTGERVFLHLFDWNGTEIQLPPFGDAIHGARMRNGGALEIDNSADGLHLRAAAVDCDPINTIIELRPGREVLRMAPIAARITCDAIASNVRNNDPEFAPSRAVDEDAGSFWATDDGVTTAWLEIRLQQSQLIRSVEIEEAIGRNVTRFSLEAWADESWHTLYEAAEIGGPWSCHQHNFDPILTNRLRLNIHDATAPPAIAEIRFSGRAVGQE